MKDAAGTHILLVEDDPRMRRSFERAARTWHCAVGAVSSESEALDAIQTEDYDVVIVDYLLPDGDGLQCIEDLRRLMPNARYVLTSGDLEVPTSRARHAKIQLDTVVQKPWDMEQLHAIIDQLSAGRRTTTGPGTAPRAHRSMALAVVLGVLVTVAIPLASAWLRAEARYRLETMAQTVLNTFGDQAPDVARLQRQLNATPPATVYVALIDADERLVNLALDPEKLRIVGTAAPKQREAILTWLRGTGTIETLVVHSSGKARHYLELGLDWHTAGLFMASAPWPLAMTLGLLCAWLLGGLHFALRSQQARRASNGDLA